VIGFHQFITGVVMGLILIVIGFVPGLLDKWAEGISRVSGALLSMLYGSPVPSREPAEFGPQRWVGALGMALIALSLYLYSVR
jgi:hypothetical protein